MSQPKKEGASSTTINVRLRNMFLVILAAFCTFGGPFLVYLLSRLLGADVIISVACGFALFFFGLGLIVFMISKKIIT
jgi:hypothetical protein